MDTCLFSLFVSLFPLLAISARGILGLISNNWDKHIVRNKHSSKEFFLPPELLEEIYKRLAITDRIRFGSVCKAWLSVVISGKPHIRPPVPEPWLMLGHRGHQFHCLSDKRVYRFNNAVPEEYKVLTMSSNGWLLTEIPLCSHLNLVNPILNAQIRMIPPRPNGLFDVKNLKKLLVLAPAGPTVSTESIVTPLIMLARSGKARIYTNYQFHELGHNCFRYEDVVLHDGKLHALMIKKPCFGVHVYDKERFDFVQQSYSIRGIAPNSEKDEACLVQSGGDLLVVRRKPNDLLQTAGFEVFKVATVRTRDAVELQTLGDHQALFWGGGGCFSLTVGESSPFEKDHIYFTHVLEEEQLTEYGMYSLKDGSIQQIPNLNLPRPPSSSTESFWFAPSPNS